MDSKLIKQRWGWEYVSKNGNSYSIGPVTSEFNVVVDDFEDVNQLFDCEAIVHSCLVDYVYGEIESDPNEIKEWLDWRIDKYENHERTVVFYTNLIKRDDVNIRYECYIGTREKKTEPATIITKDRMIDIAKEINGGK